MSEMHDYAFAEKYHKLRYEEQIKKSRIIFKFLGNEKTLDVGCGTGISSELFTDVIGVDPSEELLKFNKNKCFKASAEDLPFDDNSFENVISVTAIHNFNDIEEGLKEMKRVGRHFGFSVLKRSEKLKEIWEKIGELFIVNEIIDEGIDMIFICEK